MILYIEDIVTVCGDIFLAPQFSWSWLRSYGTGGGPRHSKYFKCSGSELRLSECESFNETVSRSSRFDVAIECHTGMCLPTRAYVIEILCNIIFFISQPLVITVI